MEDKIQLKISIKFETAEDAKISYQAILPEIEDHRFDRSQVSLNVTNETIDIVITSSDIPAAKANFNAILRWISVVNESIQLIPKKIVKTETRK